jgi:hypothetical protein
MGHGKNAEALGITAQKVVLTAISFFHENSHRL